MPCRSKNSTFCWSMFTPFVFAQGHARDVKELLVSQCFQRTASELVLSKNSQSASAFKEQLVSQCFQLVSQCFQRTASQPVLSKNSTFWSRLARGLARDVLVSQYFQRTLLSGQGSLEGLPEMSKNSQSASTFKEQYFLVKARSRACRRCQRTVLYTVEGLPKMQKVQQKNRTFCQCCLKTYYSFITIARVIINFPSKQTETTCSNKKKFNKNREEVGMTKV